MKRDTSDMGGRGTRARSRSRSTKPEATSRSRSGKQTRSAGRSQSRSRSSRGGSAQSTTDLKTIRKWAEARGGKPVSVKGTNRGGAAGLLRIDFPGYSGQGRFEEISWDEWYGKFKESNLEFLYQDQTSDGEESRFFKLVCRGTSEQKRGGQKKSKSSGRTRTASKKR